MWFCSTVAVITQPALTLLWNSGRFWLSFPLKRVAAAIRFRLPWLCPRPEEDAEGLRAFAALHKELIVASSYSKNFGLYNERVGACTLVAADAETVDRALAR